MEELLEKLKGEIIEQLNLEDVKAEDIGNDDPLFGDGLGLDSIDALELIVLLDQNYGIAIANPEEGREIFQSVQSIADYIEANRN
ncbi:MAG: phosphopantetheine-binding protein [Flavobacteriales bacterium]|jgi:acyl carrier protein|nr:phosphopantetheine-binding protein [Flavobacteriales bacterium]